MFFLLEKVVAMYCGEEGYKEAKKEFKRREGQKTTQKYRSSRRR